MHWPDREINTKVTTGTSFFDIKIYILEFSERDLTLQSNCKRIVCTICECIIMSSVLFCPWIYLSECRNECVSFISAHVNLCVCVYSFAYQMQQMNANEERKIKSFGSWLCNAHFCAVIGNENLNSELIQPSRLRFAGRNLNTVSYSISRIITSMNLDGLLIGPSRRQNLLELLMNNTYLPTTSMHRCIINNFEMFLRDFRCRQNHLMIEIHNRNPNGSYLEFGNFWCSLKFKVCFKPQLLFGSCVS